MIGKIRKESWKEVLTIAWPLIIANAFWNLQITIDRIFLGQFSADALGAAIAAVGIFWTPMALVQQTSAYVTTFVAQYSGAKEENMIGAALWHSIYLAIIGGLLFLLLIPLSSSIFHLFGHSEKLQQLEIDYFTALCFSALPTALVASISGFFTGIERSSLIMRLNGVGLVVNVVLDYIMIFGNFGFPRMGIYGAGLATALASSAAALYGLYLIYRADYKSRYHFKEGLRINFDLAKRFLRFGLPSGMQWALEGLAFTVFLIYVGRMPNGDAALAASAITVTIMMLSVLPAMGVAQAVAVLVGKYLGEKRAELAERASWSGVQISFIYIVTLGSSFIFFPHFYMGWFHNAENQALWNEIVVIVPWLLMFVAFFTAFDCMNLIFSFALKGAGDTKFVTLVALTLPWPLMVFPTYLASTHETGIYWSWGAATVFIVTQAFVFLKRFTGGKWKSMSVIH